MGNPTIDSIGPTALALLAGIICIAVCVLVLSSMVPATYTTNTLYFNYTFTANSTNLPVLGGSAALQDITRLTVYNDTTQNIGAPGVLDTHWHYYMNNNTLLVLPTSWAGSNPIKSVNYYYSADSNATIIVGSGLMAIYSFGSWFGIIVVVVVATIILSIVLLLRGRGGEG
jgi:hypothetical protein